MKTRKRKNRAKHNQRVRAVRKQMAKEQADARKKAEREARQSDR